MNAMLTSRAARWTLPAGLLLGLASGAALRAQDTPYGCDSFLVEETYVDLGAAFHTDYFTSYSAMMPRGLYEDAGGGLHMAYLANYELFYYHSADGGATWTGEQVPTGHEGDLYRAVIAADATGKPYIAFTANAFYNYGNPTGVGFGVEFVYDAYLAERDEGTWSVDPVYLSSGNYGFKVNDLAVRPDGSLTIYGHRYGWSSVGGELWAFTRDAGGVWGPVEVLQAYADVGIDQFLYAVRYHEAPDGARSLIYGRTTSPAGTPELAAIHHDGSVWNGPWVLAPRVSNGSAWDWTWNDDGTLWTVAIDNAAEPPLLWSEDLAPATPLDVGLATGTQLDAVRLHMDRDRLLNLALWPTGSDSVWVFVSRDSGRTWCAPFHRDRARFGSVYPAVDGAAGRLPSFGYPFISRVSVTEPYGPDSLFYARVSHGDSATVPSGWPSAEGPDWRMTLFPNPAREGTVLQWTAPRPARWLLRVTDARGRTLDQRSLGPLDAGTLSIRLNLAGFPAGTYGVELVATDPSGVRQREHRRFVLAR